ncbi:MAG TPA: Crp/Fnr family transcriptional regulator [Rhizomicrobium sp.]|jgi:CRP-like cAMP-binding protein|nr:Crp/Fnr family transcriptional regulator [Rhizomicrobium sp.]
MSSAASRPRNLFLRSISDADFAAFAGILERTELPARADLEVCGRTVEWVYFPESGIATVLAKGGRHGEIEVGSIGYENITGLSIFLGDDRACYTIRTQTPGRAWRAPARRVRALLHDRPSCRVAGLPFVNAFQALLGSTSLANGRATLEERLARWLLMAQDRLEDDTFHVTHKLLAHAMGARTASICLAAKALEHRGLVVKTHSRIRILDRQGLEAFAADIYGAAERESSRLVGWMPGLQRLEHRDTSADLRPQFLSA